LCPSAQQRMTGIVVELHDRKTLGQSKKLFSASSMSRRCSMNNLLRLGPLDCRLLSRPARRGLPHHAPACMPSSNALSLTASPKKARWRCIWLECRGHPLARARTPERAGCRIPRARLPSLLKRLRPEKPCKSAKETLRSADWRCQTHPERDGAQEVAGARRTSSGVRRRDPHHKKSR